jgi:hypothetical protein
MCHELVVHATDSISNVYVQVNIWDEVVFNDPMKTQEILATSIKSLS